MSGFDPRPAIAALESVSDTRFGATPEAQATYLNELKARISGRSPDDKKEATKLAVETAKMLITVGIAVLVAAGTMLQFARSGGLGWQSPTIICFGVAVAFLIASMTSGFSAISAVYKQADGRNGMVGDPWSTVPIVGKLNLQSGFGMIAIVALLSGLYLWAESEQTTITAVTVTIPATSHLSAAHGPLTISGSWTELRLQTSGNQELRLPPGSAPISIACK
jgi:hypothetical protein